MAVDKNSDGAGRGPCPGDLVVAPEYGVMRLGLPKHPDHFDIAFTRD